MLQDPWNSVGCNFYKKLIEMLHFLLFQIIYRYSYQCFHYSVKKIFSIKTPYLYFVFLVNCFIVRLQKYLIKFEREKPKLDFRWEIFMYRYFNFQIWSNYSFVTLTYFSNNLAFIHLMVKLLKKYVHLLKKFNVKLFPSW